MSRTAYNFLNREVWILLLSTGVVASVVFSFGFFASTSPGVVRGYHDNGQLASEKQVDTEGKTHGSLREWFESGILKREGKYEHGLVVSMKEYYADGRPCSETREGPNFEAIYTVFPQ